MLQTGKQKRKRGGVRVVGVNPRDEVEHFLHVGAIEHGQVALHGEEREERKRPGAVPRTVEDVRVEVVALVVVLKVLLSNRKKKRVGIRKE
jgi:hypothetical protein